MTTLRLLHIFAILLFFTPFFQMCSGEEDASVAEAVDGTMVDARDTITTGSHAVRDSAVTNHRSAAAPPLEDANSSVWKDFWELITVPGENMTMTAFGLFAQFFFEILDTHVTDIWLGSVFTIVSMVLTIASFVKLIKRKSRSLLFIHVANAICLIALFITALVTLDHFYQIKWGFYSYTLVTVVLIYRTRPYYQPGFPERLVAS
jgi:hypothetical protein